MIRLSSILLFLVLFVQGMEPLSHAAENKKHTSAHISISSIGKSQVKVVSIAPTRGLSLSLGVYGASLLHV